MNTSGEYEEGSERLRRIMGWSIVVSGLGSIGWFGAEIFFGSLRDVVFGMARVHYATVIGIPSSGLGALFIVLLLRNVAGLRVRGPRSIGTNPHVDSLLLGTYFRDDQDLGLGATEQRRIAPTHRNPQVVVGGSTMDRCHAMPPPTEAVPDLAS